MVSAFWRTQRRHSWYQVYSKKKIDKDLGNHCCSSQFGFPVYRICRTANGSHISGMNGWIILGAKPLRPVERSLNEEWRDMMSMGWRFKTKSHYPSLCQTPLWARGLCPEEVLFSAESPFSSIFIFFVVRVISTYWLLPFFPVWQSSYIQFSCFNLS